MRNLLLVRHAEAVQRGTEGVAEEERPLTPTGQDQAAHLGQWIQDQGLTVSKILTSPLVRARQTAEGLVKHLGGTGVEVVDCPELAPSHSRRKLAKALRELNQPDLLLVGHEPDLGEFVAWLIGSKRGQIEFAKGGIACVTFEKLPRKGLGTLAWLVTPAHQVLKERHAETAPKEHAEEPPHSVAVKGNEEL